MTETRRRSIDSGATCTDAVESFLEAVAGRDADLRAFVQVDSARLRAEATMKDAVPQGARGPLHGRLVAVKEVLDVAGYTCGWGTPIHRDRIPTKDAAAARLLRKAGAIIAGITVSTEYAMSRVGPTVNPWDPARTPGASSQGSAAAVGAGLVPLALGSQTIGSVIRPAAYCGCVGVKPSWGVIDVTGCMPLAAPIDHVGFMAASTDLARSVLALLAPRLDAAVRPDRVIAIQPWYDAETDANVIAAVASAVEVLGTTGLPIVQAELPAWITKTEAQVLDTILAHGMARHHAADFDRAGDRMTGRIRDYITRGRALPESAYAAALRDRERIAGSLDELLGDGIALIPATTGIAPLLRDGTGSRDPQRLWSLAGCPATTVPFGLAAGMPLGVQIVAARGHDHAVLAAAAQLQAAAALAD